MGISEERGITSSLALIIAHLLKWQYQPERRGRSWENTIKREREEVKIRLTDRPGLRRKLSIFREKAYNAAKLQASTETSMNKKTFPEECPYSFEEITNDEFYPEAR